MRPVIVAALLGLTGSGCITKAEHDKLVEEMTAKLKAQQEACAEAARGRTAENERVRAELAAQIERMKQKAGALSGKLAATAAEMAELRRSRELLERQTRIYRDLVGKFRSMIDAKTLSVRVRKGRLVVEMSDRVLFDPGKTQVKPGGKKALTEMAGVLKGITDREFLVVGHTDNRPVKASGFKSNWELSTARALEVLKLLQEAGVSPSQLGAAGYSQYDPVAKNTSEKSRALNRRIEIVLMPRIAELTQVVE